MTPDPVLFVARNLDVWPVPAYLAGDAIAFSSTHRPYYRLTPAVWVWLCHAVDNLAQRPGADRAQVHAGADLVVSLGSYVAAHYAADAIRAAWQSPPRLPDAPKPIRDGQESGSPRVWVSHLFPLSRTPHDATQAADVPNAAPPTTAV